MSCASQDDTAVGCASRDLSFEALCAALERSLAKYTSITYNIEVPQKRIPVEFQPRLVQPTTQISCDRRETR